MPDQKPVAILGGSGALGSSLALRLGAKGVPIVIGSRSQERADEAVAKLKEQIPNGSFEGFENREAATKANVVFLTVPFRSQSETLTVIKGVVEPDQIVVDATVPLAAAVSGKATRTLGVWQGSAAQQAQEMLPDHVEIVSALHTVSAKPLGDLEHALNEDTLVCGDCKAAKRTVAGLLSLIDGLRPVDGGKLEMSRLTEQLTPLLISINMRYKSHAGVHFTGLPEELWPE